jgi:hypothetical protein
MGYLRGVRVATAILMLAFVCGSSSKLLRRTTPRDLRGDFFSAADRRLAAVRSVVPPSAVVCFLHAPDVALDQRFQYAVAPILVKPGSDCELVVSYFAGANRNLLERFTTLRDLGDGLVVSRRTTQ